MRRRTLLAGGTVVALVLAAALGVVALDVLAVPSALRAERAAWEAGGTPSVERDPATRLARALVAPRGATALARIVSLSEQAPSDPTNGDYAARAGRLAATLPSNAERSQALARHALLLLIASDELLRENSGVHADPRTFAGIVRLYEVAERELEEAIRLDPEHAETTKLDLEILLRHLQEQRIRVPRASPWRGRPAGSRLLQIPAVPAHHESSGVGVLAPHSGAGF